MNWIVGGSPRNGKTTLLKALTGETGGQWGFKLKACLWFTCIAFFYALGCGALGFLEKVLREYLTRTRFLDGSGKTKASPIDFFSASLTNVVCTAAQGGGHQISAIARSLDVLAKEHSASGWAVCDIYPEFRYLSLRKHIPGLKLAVVFRDPRESVAAALYWRTFPERVQIAEALMLHHIAVWRLSAMTAYRYKKLYPDDVLIVPFNDLVAGNDDAIHTVAQKMGVADEALEKVIPSNPYFSMNSNNQMLCPDGTYRDLLTQEEQNLIIHQTGQWFDHLKDTGTSNLNVRKWMGFRLMSFFAYGMWKIHPEAGKILVDFMFLPRIFLRRRFNVFKQIIKDNLLIWIRRD